MRIKRFSEWKRGWRVATKVVGVSLVVGPTYLLRDVIQANWIYNSVYETAKREGAIVTAADLRAITAVPDAENAAPIIMAEVAKWRERKDSGLRKVLDSLKPLEITPSYGTPKPTEAELAEARHVLAKVSAELKPLEAVLAKPHCNFKHDWEQGPALIFPELAFIYGAVKVTSLQAAEYVKQGRVAEGVQKYRLGFHLGRLIGETPVLSSAQVQVKGNATLRESIANSLAKPPSESFLKQIRELCEEFSTPIDPRHAMRGELFFNWDMARRVIERSSGPTHPENHEVEVVLQLAMIPGVERSWKTRSLEWCIATNRKLKLSHGDPIRSSALVAIRRDFNDESGLSNYLSGILQPNFGVSHEAYVRDIAGHDALLATLDVLDARQKLGRWPDALPVSRRDPFGARTLRYRKDGTGVRIWSIGPDFKDDNGLPKSEKSDSDDIVIKL